MEQSDKEKFLALIIDARLDEAIKMLPRNIIPDEVYNDIMRLETERVIAYSNQVHNHHNKIDISGKKVPKRPETIPNYLELGEKCNDAVLKLIGIGKEHFK